MENCTLEKPTLPLNVFRDSSITKGNFHVLIYSFWTYVHIGPETRVALKCMFVYTLYSLVQYILERHWLSHVHVSLSLFSNFPSLIISFSILFSFSDFLTFSPTIMFFLFFHHIWILCVIAYRYDFSCFSQWIGNNFHGSIFS